MGLWDKFMSVFDLLPVAALVTRGEGGAAKYFCVHGGLASTTCDAWKDHMTSTLTVSLSTYVGAIRV